MLLNDCAIMFSSRNWFDELQLSPSTTWGLAGFPVQNAASAEMYQFTRTDQYSPIIECSLDGVKPVDVVAALKINCTVGSFWRIQLYNDSNDPSGSEEYDSGWVPMFPGINLYGVAPWGGFDWGGVAYNLEDGHYNRQAVHVLPSQTFAKYIKVSFDLEETVRTLGFAQMARFWIGEGYQPEHSAVYGSGIKFIDNTLIKEAESGIKHRNKRIIKRRGMRVILENEPKLGLLYGLVGPVVASRGTSMDFLTLLEPRDTASLAFQTIYGSIAGNSISVEHGVWDRMGVTLDLEESI